MSPTLSGNIILSSTYSNVSYSYVWFFLWLTPAIKKYSLSFNKYTTSIQSAYWTTTGVEISFFTPPSRNALLYREGRVGGECRCVCFIAGWASINCPWRPEPNRFLYPWPSAWSLRRGLHWRKWRRDEVGLQYYAMDYFTIIHSSLRYCRKKHYSALHCKRQCT